MHDLYNAQPHPGQLFYAYEVYHIVRCFDKYMARNAAWKYSTRRRSRKVPGKNSLNYDFSFLGKFDVRPLHDVKSKLHEFVIVHVSR